MNPVHIISAWLVGAALIGIGTDKINGTNLAATPMFVGVALAIVAVVGIVKSSKVWNSRE